MGQKLRAIAPDVWVLHVSQKVPLFGEIGAKMTVLRLRNGDIALISPVPMDHEVAVTIRSLGTVRWIISPNGLHHLHIQNALVHFPQAELWGPAKTRQKRRDLHFHGVFTDQVGPAWGDEMAYLVIPARSSVGEEIIFFHFASRTLVVTDLLFHVCDPGSWWNRLWMEMNGALGRLITTRMGRVVFPDRAALRRVRDQVLGWQPQQLIMAHGELVTEGLEERLPRAFAWLG